MAPSRPVRPAGAKDLCDYPEVYDAAFCWDRSREAETYLQVASDLRGRAVRSAVELACGTGPLGRRWAAKGVKVYGIDRSEPSISRARELSAGTVPAGRWTVGDLRRFSLPRPVDLAVVALDGLGYLVDEPDLLSFFRCARAALLPGGVLAADLTLHPPGRPPLPIRNAWTVRLRPKGSLHTSWRSVGPSWGQPPRRWEVGSVTVRTPAGPRQMFWEATPHLVATAEDLRTWADRAGGFGPLTVFSDSAHRGRDTPLRRWRAARSPLGAHLLAWVRTPILRRAVPRPDVRRAST